MRKKTGGRVKGTPNKLTATIKEQLGNLADEVLESIDINLFSKAEKIKLLQIILQYVMPRLQAQHIELDQEEKLRNVTIRVLDGEGNSIKEYKSMSDTIQSLDEKDLGLLEDMDKIIWGDNKKR